MEDLTSKTVAVFARPFTVPGFNETLPAGEYEIETELVSPPDQKDPAAWKASVLVKLHPRTSHPGLARTLTVSLADLDHARARDKLTGKALSDFFLEEMLADPMVRLVMKADGVSEAHLRHLYSERGTPDPDLNVPASANDHPKNAGTMRQSRPPKTKECLQDGNTVAIAQPPSSGTDLMSDKAMAEGEWHTLRPFGPGATFRRNANACGAKPFLERRVRRADLSALQGIERLAKRRARQPGSSRRR
jgi:hypothetical protein